MPIRINVEEEIKTLAQEWGKANIYFVGGYVRDLMMGIKPKDYDLVIDSPNGTSEFIDWLKENKSDKCSGFVVYERYGTAKFTLLNKIEVECVIPRTETYNSGPRKPDHIDYTGIKEDAKRRDFCCNALYKNVITGEILDPTGHGLKDIESKILRTPLDPEQTFIDDPLRMLRAFRFAYRKQFTILPGVKEKIKPYPEYMKLSMERVRDEFTKILLSYDPCNAIRELHETGLLNYIIPELEESWGFNQNTKYHSLNLTDHLLSVLGFVNREQNLELSLAALLHDISKAKNYQVNKDTSFSFKGHEELSATMARSILERLKYPGSTIDTVCELIRNHMIIKPLYNYDTKEYTGKAKKTRQIKTNFSLDFLKKLMWLIDADNLSHAPKYNMPGQVDSFWQKYRSVDEVVEKEPDFISGSEIMKELEIEKPGIIVGEIKHILQDWHLENPELSKEELFQKYKFKFSGGTFWTEHGTIYLDEAVKIELNDEDAKYLGPEKRELKASEYPKFWSWLQDYRKARGIIDEASEILWKLYEIPGFEQLDLCCDDWRDFSGRIQWKHRKDDYLL
jgi:putative nucleotidyltransferase with HDIG domain